jgi:hypothetical protein
MKFRSQIQIEHAPSEQMVVVRTTPGFELNTAAEMTAAIDVFVADIRAATRGKPIYLVVDYTNLKYSLALNEHLRAETVRLMRDANVVTIVRYGADDLMRAAARTRAMRMHMPSHLYPTFEEARQVVADLRSGRITIGR